MLINIYYPENVGISLEVSGFFNTFAIVKLVKTERRNTEGPRFIPFQTTLHCKDTGFSWFLQIFLVNMSKNNKA